MTTGASFSAYAPMNTGDFQLTVIAKVTEEFLEAVRDRKSEPPEALIDEFAAKYPKIAGHVRDLFPALVGLEKVAKHSEKAANIARDNTEFPVFNDYRIIREIGRGGMGIVYEAHQISLDRKVALKILSLDPQSNPDFVERFRREAQIAASLHHSNIVPVYEVGCENGYYFFTMQFIRGVNLSDLCRPTSSTNVNAGTIPLFKNSTDDESTKQIRTVATALKIESPTSKRPQQESERDQRKTNRSIDQKTIARIGSQIADALDHIHCQGIVHRDIKPSNILLDENGTAWLTDWGLVKSGFSELTQTGDLFGSLPYMSPERFKGQSDAQSDIYSLGATLYELLTLRRMFEVKDHPQLISTIIHDHPPAPSEVVDGVDKDFDNVVMKAIEKEPALRYSTAVQFSTDLRNIIVGRPVSVRKLSVVENLMRWCRNNPAKAGLTMGLVLTLMLATVTISALMAIHQKNAAELAREGERKSEASLDVFFGSFFPESGPDVGARMDPVYRQAMDDAVADIIEDANKDSVVVGKLFIKLGWIYFNQERYDQALLVFRHAFERIRDDKAYGIRDKTALQALDKIGMVLMRLDRFEESETTLKRAFKLQSELLGPEHPATIHSLAKLGDLYAYTGDFERAIALTQQVMEIRDDPSRRDFKFVQTSQNGLALLFIQLGEPEQAIVLLEKVVAFREQNNQKNIGASINMYNLARAYQIVGRLDEAMKMVDKSIQIRLENAETESDRVACAKALKAAIVRDQGELDVANRLFSDLWQVVESAASENTKALIFLDWGLCLKELARYDQAMAKLDTAHSILAKTRTNKNYYTRLAALAIQEICELD